MSSMADNTEAQAMRIRFATIEKRTVDTKVAWRFWPDVPRRGDHVSLKADGIFGMVVSVMWTDRHIAVVVKP